MFWDSSAIVPLLVPEARSAALAAAVASDDQPAAWWACTLECLSALHRGRREGRVDRRTADAAVERLLAFAEDVDIVLPTDALRERAGRLLSVHPVRAADALQLAAALAWCGDRPAGEGFVCLDRRLREAAQGEGFRVEPEDI